MKTKFLSIFLVLGMVLIFAGLAPSQGPQYTEWSALEPVSGLSLPGVNELAPNISHDGLRLYFAKAGDIYVSHRADRNADWESPIKLPSTVNVPIYGDTAPFESTDGHWLFFSSTRPGGVGSQDIWVSYRQFVHDDTAWQEAVNLTAVNSAAHDGGANIFEDKETGTIQLYLGSTRAYPGGTQALTDIYVSTLGPDGFQTPVPVTELNDATHHDGKPFVRRDGLEIFFQSHRYSPEPWGPPGYIMVSTRSSTDQPWSTPTVAIWTTPAGNPGDKWITTPSLSRDSMTLYVAVNEPGTDIGDIYVSYRQKVRGPK